MGHFFKSWAIDSLEVDKYNSYHFNMSHVWQEKTNNIKDKALMNYKVTITNKLTKTKHLHYWEFAHEQTYQYPYITEGYRNYMSYACYHTMGEWYSCAVTQETGTVLKIHQHITIPTPAGHQPL